MVVDYETLNYLMNRNVVGSEITPTLSLHMENVGFTSSRRTERPGPGRLLRRRGPVLFRPLCGHSRSAGNLGFSRR
ncbi:MAG: Peptide/nickel transport system substrate-binding protein [Naasia sp.]|nr:Peptide/nickel transport system substrate-binding protein [Naasia sp.]